MSEVLLILLLTTMAGVAIPLGGLIASFEHIRPRWLEHELRHFVIAFGGGILLGAVAVVLVPEGIEGMDNSLWAIPIVLAGGLFFFTLERRLAKGGRQSPQLMGMLSDYVPEAIALGGMMAAGSDSATLLAVLIALQNLPEGFNAFRELQQHNHTHNNSNRRTFLSMLAMVPLGPIAGLSGYYLLAGQDYLLGAIMLFASGGILYLIFQDIAPQSVLKKHWAPPLGAVFGFCLALFSNMLVASH